VDAGAADHLVGDVASSERVVTRDHDRADAGAAADSDGGLDLGAWWVDHGHHANKDQIVLHLLRRTFLWAFGQAAHAHAQYAPPFLRQIIMGGPDALAATLIQWQDLILLPYLISDPQ
jgi:hypothetical protein